MKKLTKLLSVVMALAMLLGASSALAEVTYPLEGDISLTYWLQLNPNVSAGSTSLNETPYAAGLIERTGVDVEFIHPATGQDAEQFNLLIASGKMPDIVEYTWVTSYTGGPAAAIENGIIAPLNDYLDEFAPDFKKYLDENPDVAKMCKTDDGLYYGFPMIMLDPEIITSFGPFLRQDWLDELGMEAPETMDDWTEVLTAFRDEKGCDAPFVMIYNDSFANMFYGNLFIGAYGISAGMYVDDGKVAYGPAQPAFKDFLAQMNQWFADGLLDPNFITNTSTERDANILNGQAGATNGWGAGSLGALTRAFADTDTPDALLAGTQYPVLNEGDTPMFGHKNFPVHNQIACINAKSENIEQIVQFLNYGYSEEGYYYNNFGIEGESYTMVDGKPVMADFILNPEEGSVGQAWTQYARAPYQGPFRQSLDYFLQYTGMPIIQEAVAKWAATDALEHNLPPVTVSVEDSRTYNKIYTDLESYVFEWAVQAITGAVSLDDFETSYLPTLEDIGVEEAVRIQQEAYDRFQQR